MLTKRIYHANTIEAYACMCNDSCYGCSTSCQTINCACDDFYNVPFASQSVEASNDNTGDIKGQTKPQWAKYAK